MQPANPFDLASEALSASDQVSSANEKVGRGENGYLLTIVSDNCLLRGVEQVLECPSQYLSVPREGGREYLQEYCCNYPNPS
jgi:hypothetical protein